MGVLENYKARVTGTVGSSLKEYVKNQVRTNLDTFLEKSQYGMEHYLPTLSLYNVILLTHPEYHAVRPLLYIAAVLHIHENVLPAFGRDYRKP